MIEFFRTKQLTAFKKNDSVQQWEGGPLMVVQEIIRGSPAKYRCTWYNRGEKAVNEAVFPETALKLFDWYNPEVS